MCRLLAVVAPSRAPLETLLTPEIGPFTDLAAIHCDGWGVSYWDEQDDLVTRKAPEPALTSSSYRQVLSSARTDAAILHLRKASTGMANRVENTHPFVAGSVAFAHNGYFSPLAPVEALVTAAGGRTYEGTTDSERYFALVLAGLRTAGPAEALHRAADSIAAVAEVVSLNALLLTHQSLFALAFYDEKVILAQDKEVATYALKYRLAGEEVVVASSGWEQAAPRWEQLPNGSVLEVRRRDRRITVHRMPAEVPHWPAVAG